jgi:hypothetical protein
MATARAAEMRSAVRADIAALAGRLTDLVTQLDAAADPEAAAAQIEAVQAEAAQQVASARADAARAAQLRQQAEAAAAEALSAAFASKPSWVRWTRTPAGRPRRRCCCRHLPGCGCTGVPMASRVCGCTSNRATQKALSHGRQTWQTGMNACGGRYRLAGRSRISWPESWACKHAPTRRPGLECC